MPRLVPELEFMDRRGLDSDGVQRHHHGSRTWPDGSGSLCFHKYVTILFFTSKHQAPDERYTKPRRTRSKAIDGPCEAIEKPKRMHQPANRSHVKANLVHFGALRRHYQRIESHDYPTPYHYLAIKDPYQSNQDGT